MGSDAKENMEITTPIPIVQIDPEADTGDGVPLFILPPPRPRRRMECWPRVLMLPPAHMRGLFLNQGDVYWASSVKYCTLMATVSLLQLTVFILVFGILAHYRLILMLFPFRKNLIIWFVGVTALDIIPVIIVSVGRCIIVKYSLPRRAHMVFILIATVLLIGGFLASLITPVHFTPTLYLSVKGAIQWNETGCVQVRDDFNALRNNWEHINHLRDICEHSYICLEVCRDFRDLFFWLFGTYLVSVIRLVVCIFMWNNVSFLCMIMDLREEHFSYTLKM